MAHHHEARIFLSFLIEASIIQSFMIHVLVCRSKFATLVFHCRIHYAQTFGCFWFLYWRRPNRKFYENIKPSLLLFFLGILNMLCYLFSKLLLFYEFSRQLEVQNLLYSITGYWYLTKLIFFYVTRLETFTVHYSHFKSLMLKHIYGLFLFQKHPQILLSRCQRPAVTFLYKSCLASTFLSSSENQINLWVLFCQTYHQYNSIWVQWTYSKPFFSMSLSTAAWQWHWQYQKWKILKEEVKHRRQLVSVHRLFGLLIH